MGFHRRNLLILILVFLCGVVGYSAWERTVASTRKIAVNTVASSSKKSGADSSAAISIKPLTNGLQKIKHIIVIMQENRSFDSYFGTFPHANGIPMKNGIPTVCCPDPETGKCIQPYHSASDLDGGGPHDAVAATKDIDGGKMDGFINATRGLGKCTEDDNPSCNINRDAHRVMAYHTEKELPNYWAYAKNFVLHDNMFASVASWSEPAHLYMVSEWSAHCTVKGDPMSCMNNIIGPYSMRDANNGKVIYAWTDLTYLLHKYDVSWGYYVFSGGSPDCNDDSEATCIQPYQDKKTPGIWNPLPAFDTVQQNNQLGNVQDIQDFYKQAKAGTLPAVSWVIPNEVVSEHPPSLVSVGEAYVTSLINTIMAGPDWNSTAILLAWDDWGGFYDHVVPPAVDKNGYGIRVPSMIISPYAKRGVVDHQLLSLDAQTKFIEDVFINSQRLDPKTDGRPDPRPTVRENVRILGDLTKDFDFSQEPRPPMLLPVDVAKLPAEIQEFARKK